MNTNIERGFQVYISLLLKMNLLRNTQFVFPLTKIFGDMHRLMYEKYIYTNIYIHTFYSYFKEESFNYIYIYIYIYPYLSIYLSIYMSIYLSISMYIDMKILYAKPPSHVMNKPTARTII